MTLWTGAEAQAATGGQGPADWSASGVSIDTRTLAPGDLFVALSAARDGHEFVAQALANGAAAALVSRVPENVPADAPLLVVPDVQAALEALGQAARARSAARIGAITGSVGKTSCKEMLRAALAGQARVHAAVASYNNHWGVPLSLARMPADTEIGIFEIGMSAPGEIAPLARQVRPDVALITTIAPAHIAAFGDLEGIAREKASIAQGLSADGALIINADLPSSSILRAAFAGQVTGFGEKPEADWRLQGLELAPGRTQFELSGAVKGQVTLAAEGRHLATNAVGVLAMAVALGGTLGASIEGLAQWAPPTGRGARQQVPLPGDAGVFELIDDAFNANPASMAAALEVLAATRPKGRRIAVLGDMYELGDDELAQHRAFASHNALRGIDLVHCVGSRMRALHEALPQAKRGLWWPEAHQAADAVPPLIKAGDCVLIKGSKSSEVSCVVDALAKLAKRTDPKTTRE